MVLAVADVAVTVTNARAAARWWEENLGFRTFTLDGKTGHAVMVAPPGDRYLLHLCEGFAPLDPGNTGIAFMTDDIDALVRRMVAGGVRFPEPLQKQEWGAMAKFADPDGNVFWLMGAPAKFIRESLSNRAPASQKPSRTATTKTSARRPSDRRGAGD